MCAYVCDKLSLSHRRKSQKNTVGLLGTEEQLFGSEVTVCPAVIRQLGAEVQFISS